MKTFKKTLNLFMLLCLLMFPLYLAKDKNPHVLSAYASLNHPSLHYMPAIYNMLPL